MGFSDYEIYRIFQKAPYNPYGNNDWLNITETKEFVVKWIVLGLTDIQIANLLGVSTKQMRYKLDEWSYKYIDGVWAKNE